MVDSYVLAIYHLSDYALAHLCGRNHGVVHPIVDVLLVVLHSIEKEELVAVVVQLRSRNDDRATNVKTRVKVSCLGLRSYRSTIGKQASVLVLRIVGVQVPIAGIHVSLAVKLLATRLADRA